MSRFRNRTPPWQYLRAFQIDGIAVSRLSYSPELANGALERQ